MLYRITELEKVEGANYILILNHSVILLTSVSNFSMMWRGLILTVLHLVLLLQVSFVRHYNDSIFWLLYIIVIDTI